MREVSVLGYLCNFYINDMALAINNDVSKITSGTTVGRLIRTDQKANEWQGDLDRLYE